MLASLACGSSAIAQNQQSLRDSRRPDGGQFRPTSPKLEEVTVSANWMKRETRSSPTSARRLHHRPGTDPTLPLGENASFNQTAAAPRPVWHRIPLPASCPQ